MKKYLLLYIESIKENIDLRNFSNALPTELPVRITVLLSQATQLQIIIKDVCGWWTGWDSNPRPQHDQCYEVAVISNYLNAILVKKIGSVNGQNRNYFRNYIKNHTLIVPISCGRVTINF